MAGQQKDVTGVNCLRNDEGEVLVEEQQIKNRWRKYMQKLLNEENEWNREVVSEAVQGPRELITKTEVEQAIKEMKSGKAGGPSEVVGEMINAAGKNGVDMMTKLCNQIIEEGRIPLDWEISTLVPVYKGKGDPLECGSYRAIKLLEHAMKVLERVLDRRIRQKVNIDCMQFGFMPGKGTVDAIFICRQLQEKYLEKTKDLYFAFVDLEKAFDRVPRDVVWWSLRKFGVEEWIIQTVMAMYTKAKTTVWT